jgi:multidrug resistance efflux pump
MNVLSLPLRREGEVFAVLTLERPADRAFVIAEIESIRLACELCTPRLMSAYEHDRWFGARIAAKMRKLFGVLLGSEHTWAKLATVLVFAGLMFITFAKGMFKAEAPFILEAVQQQVIPAPFEGYLKSVEVEVDDDVVGGETVLATLDTAELRLQLAAARAEKAGYSKQAAAAMRDGQTAKAQIAEASGEKTDAEIDLLTFKISQADLISPLSGKVVQGDLKRQIGAPVKTGDILFEVTPVEAIRAELMVREDEIFDVEVGQEGYLATFSYPAKRIRFEVERIEPMAEVVNQRNVFRVRVRLDETPSWMRPGMEGVSKVHVGKRRYIWIWTRKIVNWIRMKLWF